MIKSAQSVVAAEMIAAEHGVALASFVVPPPGGHPFHKRRGAGGGTGWSLAAVVGLFATAVVLARRS